LPAFERHVFVCHNVRPEGAPRPSCTADGKSDLHAELQQLAKAAGLGTKVRINKSGCLDQCEHGPMVVVYPEASGTATCNPRTRRRLSPSTWSRAAGRAAAPAESA
jgi:predicted metal-binding protein